MNRIHLKERIATNGQFSLEERTFLLDAVNSMPEITAEMEIQVPGNTIERIEQIWCYLSVDNTGEGICAAPLDGQHTIPLIGADKRRVDSLKPWAVTMARIIGTPIRLVKFSNRELVEIIRP